MNNQEKIKKIQDWQNNSFVHSLTCGNDSTHRNLVPTEYEDNVILLCLDCNYIQTNIPECILNFDLSIYDQLKNKGLYNKQKDVVEKNKPKGNTPTERDKKDTKKEITREKIKELVCRGCSGACFNGYDYCDKFYELQEKYKKYGI